MGGGSGGGNTTTTTKADPWIGVQPYLGDAYSQLSQLYNNGQDPKYFPGSTVANPSALEQQGQNTQLSQLGNVDALGWRGLENTNTMSWLGGQGGSSGLNSANTAIANLDKLGNNAYGGADTANNAMNDLLGYGYNNTAAGTAGGLSAMQQLNQAGDFQNNPAFQAALQSAIRPVTQNFQEQVMPAIQQGAQAAGQMGGSRQGIAEGIAARGYQDTIGDISANMGNSAYAQGLQALQASGQLGTNLAGMGLGATGTAGQLGAGMAGLANSAFGNAGQLGSNIYGTGQQSLGQATALVPGAQQGMLAAGQVQSQLGQQNTADQQAQLSDQVNRYNFEQNLPYTMIQDYLTALNGGAGLGGMQTAQQSGGGGSRATGALGGAASGAAIGSAFGPGYGTAIGAGLGAMYGLFA